MHDILYCIMLCFDVCSKHTVLYVVVLHLSSNITTHDLIEMIEFIYLFIYLWRGGEGRGGNC